MFTLLLSAPTKVNHCHLVNITLYKLIKHCTISILIETKVNVQSAVDIN